MIKYIYKITSPSGKIYIGKTVNLKRRMSSYAAGRCKKQKHLYRSIKKYGWEAHSVELVFEGVCSSKCLSRLERLYIDMYDSFNTGLNLTEGGGGLRGFKQTEEHKRKIGDANRGRQLPPISEETRAKLSAAGKGRKQSEEHIAKRAAANKGRKLSPETIAKRTAARKINRAIKALQTLINDGKEK